METCLTTEPDVVIGRAHCVAGTNLPKGIYCGPVPDLNFSTANIDFPEYFRPLKVYAKGNAMLVTDATVTSWTSFILPARDIHEQNAQIFRSHDAALYIRATRDIARGETLRCWFEESLAMEKHVPYLTPANILGSQKYMCTRCQMMFIYPNLLKLHMLNDCQSSRVVASHTVTQNGGPLQNNVTQQQGRERHTNPTIYKSHVPVTKRQLINTKYGDLNSAIMNGCSSESQSHVHANCFDVENQNHALEIHHDISHDVIEHVEEEPMDILSKSFLEFSTKDGHLCIYCGKFYSRKYGLKIHLRTHTGFKPLKCKVCLRAFGDPSNLNKHIRLHAEGNAPYPCVHCGKVLMRRRDLTRHIKSRHPVRCVNI